MLIFEAACPIFYDVVFTPSQHEKPCAIKKASSFNAFRLWLCLHGRAIGSEVLREIGDRVAGDGHRRRAPRRTGGRLRIDARGMVDKVACKAGRLDLLLGQRARELMDDGADHLQMAQLLGAQRSIGNVPMYQI